MQVCGTCGAMAADPGIHAAWHERTSALIAGILNDLNAPTATEEPS